MTKLHLFRDPIADQQIISRRDQAAEGQKCPGRRRVKSPGKQPAQEEGLGQGIDRNQDATGEIAVQAVYPADDGERRPGPDQDDAQPEQNLARAGNQHVAGGGVHLPPGDSADDDAQDDQPGDDLSGNAFEKLHPGEFYPMTGLIALKMTRQPEKRRPVAPHVDAGLPNPYTCGPKMIRSSHAPPARQSYDLRASPEICPECGTPSERHQKERMIPWLKNKHYL